MSRRLVAVVAAVVATGLAVAGPAVAEVHDPAPAARPEARHAVPPTAQERSPAAVVEVAGPPSGRQLDHAVRVTRGDGARFVDDAGRTVLLRGINVNQLAEYHQASPPHRPTIPLTEADFAGIAALGFDVVRLLTTWSRWEPQPGVFDEAYLAEVRQAVEWARAHDLYVLIDMHQDAWGPHVATPPGERCLPGFSPAVGWDGAPAWATLTDGLPTCRLAQRELSLAVAQAWTSFYLDRRGPGGVGIQTRLVRTWGRIAEAFAGDPAVVGYDLLNEPNPGHFVETLLLGRFYDRAIGAIRAGERRGGGAPRPVFFEPSALWSALVVHPTPLPGFSTDPQLVFAPHVYASSISLTASTPLDALLGIETGHDLAALWARLHRTTYVSGEWGWYGDPATEAAEVAAYARAEDARLVGGMWWSWKQACGDPHQIARPGAPPYAVSPSLVRFACPGDHELGIPEPFGQILSRAYPRAAPGRLLAMDSDPATGTLHVRGQVRGAGSAEAPLDLWVPDRGLGAPAVSGAGVGAVEVAPVPGGWRVLVEVSGAYDVRVEAR